MSFSADTLLDRVAIVTGASQGIGRAVAIELASVGAHVVACSRRRSALEIVAGEIRAQGRRALALVCDVGAERQVEDVVARTGGDGRRAGRLEDSRGDRASGARGPAPAARPPRRDRVDGGVRRVGSGQLHDRGDRVRKRWSAGGEPRGLRTRARIEMAADRAEVLIIGAGAAALPSPGCLRGPGERGPGSTLAR
jgi:NAD(P)-dependent dehydrogenase (short-subunit alcohol dehydrogenase family)